MELDKLHEALNQTLKELIKDHDDGLAKAKDVFGENHIEVASTGMVEKGPLKGCKVRVSIEVNPSDDEE